MGYFERNLGAIGEAVDGGIDRAKETTRDLCDRRGWTDRADSLREAVRERGEGWWAAGARSWRDLGEDLRKRVIAGAALAAVLAAVFIGRSLLIRREPPPSKADLDLIASVRAKSEASNPWTGRAEGLSRSPLGNR